MLRTGIWIFHPFSVSFQTVVAHSDKRDVHVSEESYCHHYLRWMFGCSDFCRGARFALVCSPGELQAAQPDGKALWKIRLANDRGGATARWDGQVALLSNGLLIDATGRLLCMNAQFAPAEALAPGATDAWPEPAWDEPLFEIAPPPPPDIADYHNTPLLDRAGNAWLILTHWEGTHCDLQSRKSVGHSGDWGPVQTIHGGTSYILATEAVMDSDENITVAFREGGYHLKVLRYTPAGGWEPAQTLYSTSTFFQAIEAGVDQAGNVAVVFDLSPGNWPAAWTVIRNAATGLEYAGARVHVGQGFAADDPEQSADRHDVLGLPGGRRRAGRRVRAQI